MSRFSTVVVPVTASAEDVATLITSLYNPTSRAAFAPIEKQCTDFAAAVERVPAPVTHVPVTCATVGTVRKTRTPRTFVSELEPWLIVVPDATPIERVPVVSFPS